MPGRATARGRYERYIEALRDEAGRQGVALGEPRFEDDAWDAKLVLLEDDPVAAVSFTFGCPPADVVARLQAAGSSVWVTVTDVDEAQGAADAGADALIVQGIEAGGHRASFVDAEGAGEYGLLALLQLVGAHVGPAARRLGRDRLGRRAWRPSCAPGRRPRRSARPSCAARRRAPRPRTGRRSRPPRRRA